MWNQSRLIFKAKTHYQFLKGNKAADYLAAEAARRMHLPFWLDYVPSSLFSILSCNAKQANIPCVSNLVSDVRVGIG